MDALDIDGTVTWDGTLAGANEDFGAPAVWQAFILNECANMALDWCGTVDFDPGDVLLMDGSCDALPDNVYWPAFPFTTCDDGSPVTTYYGLAPAPTTC